MPPVPLGNRTKMESTAALLPKHGSRAMGFGTDCGGKRKQTNITHHKPRERRARRRVFKETDNAGFVVPLPVCVSNIRGERKKPFPSPVGPHAHPPGPGFSQNPPLCTNLQQCGPASRCRRSSGGAACGDLCRPARSRRRGLPRHTPETVIGLSAVYQPLIRVREDEFPACKQRGGPAPPTIFMALPPPRIFPSSIQIRRDFPERHLSRRQIPKRGETGGKLGRGTVSHAADAGSHTHIKSSLYTVEIWT